MAPIFFGGLFFRPQQERIGIRLMQMVFLFTALHLSVRMLLV